MEFVGGSGNASRHVFRGTGSGRVDPGRWVLVMVDRVVQVLVW